MDTGLVMFQDYTPLQKKIMNSLGTAKKKKRIYHNFIYTLSLRSIFEI